MLIEWQKASDWVITTSANTVAIKKVVLHGKSALTFFLKPTRVIGISLIDSIGFSSSLS
jgi:hypothetical protein